MLIRAITPTYNRPECMQFAYEQFIGFRRKGFDLEWVIGDQSPETDQNLLKNIRGMSQVHYIHCPSRDVDRSQHHNKHIATLEQFRSFPAQRMMELLNQGDPKVLKEKDVFINRPNISEVRNLLVDFETEDSRRENDLFVFHLDSDDLYMADWPERVAGHLASHSWGRPRLLVMFNLKNNQWTAYEAGRYWEGRYGMEFVADEIGAVRVKSKEQVAAFHEWVEKAEGARDYGWFGLSHCYRRSAWRAAGRANRTRFAQKGIDCSFIGGFLFGSRAEDGAFYNTLLKTGLPMGMMDHCRFSVVRVVGIGGSISQAQYILPKELIPRYIVKRAERLQDLIFSLKQKREGVESRP